VKVGDLIITRGKKVGVVIKICGDISDTSHSRHLYPDIWVVIEGRTMRGSPKFVEVINGKKS